MEARPDKFDPLSAEEIAKLVRLEQAATRPPWDADDIFDALNTVARNDIIQRSRIRNDCKLTAKLRNAFPRLLAAVAERDALIGMLQGDIPEAAEQIGPLSWLRSLLDDARERGPAADCDDPDAYWEMVNEVQAFHDRARVFLARIPATKSGPQSEGGQTT